MGATHAPAGSGKAYRAAALHPTAYVSPMWPYLHAHAVPQREPVWLAVQIERDYCYLWSKVERRVGQGERGKPGPASVGMMKMRLFVTASAFAVFALSFVPITGSAVAAEPTFDCSKVEAGSIEALICQDDGLSALDQNMAVVYAAAAKKAANEHPSTLKAEQRGWIKGRNDCWKSDDPRSCVEQSYTLWIAELQARYRLVPVTGSATYVCDGEPAKEVVATYFETDPPTAIAEFGDQTSLMYQQPAASGTKYQGRNEMLWEHQGEALITWGYGAPEMRCRVKR